MKIINKTALDDRFLILGMSCVGKSTFASLCQHKTICFDRWFPWHEIETLGLSLSAGLNRVVSKCEGSFVLDGWHLFDLNLEQIPNNCSVYMLGSTYGHIISQYRVNVKDYNQHAIMYWKWYTNFKKPADRFFWNNGDFIEIESKEFNEKINKEIQKLTQEKTHDFHHYC